MSPSSSTSGRAFVLRLLLFACSEVEGSFLFPRFLLDVAGVIGTLDVFRLDAARKFLVCRSNLSQLML